MTRREQRQLVEDLARHRKALAICQALKAQLRREFLEIANNLQAHAEGWKGKREELRGRPAPIPLPGDADNRIAVYDDAVTRTEELAARIRERPPFS